MWIKNEIKHMKLNDKRLNKRLEIILEALTDQPTASIPEACQSNAKTKGAYRFFSNDEVEAKKITEGARTATIERMKQQQEGSLVLFISDATNIVFTSHKKLKGIGVLKNQKARGLNLHTTLAMTTEELLLGCVEQYCWGRKPEDYGKRSQRGHLPIEQKESFRWLESFRSAQESLPDNMQGLFTCDRGGDLYDIFLEKRKPNMNLLIRSAHDRTNSETSQKMFLELESKEYSGLMEVKISRSGERKERTAHIQIRFKKITINPPKRRAKELLPSIVLHIISAKEVNDAPKAEDLIHWKLLTTVEINSLDDAKQMVFTYAKRWMIERFHYTLKEGCKVEELQLEEADRIKKAIATYTIVAWRLMYITYLSRINPNASCTKIFSDDEWEALYCYANKTANPPKKPPLLQEAIRLLAKIGGFLGRKKDGDPGVKVVWRGLRILENASSMYSILKEKRCG